jgi:hypothetical protein
VSKRPLRFYTPRRSAIIHFHRNQAEVNRLLIRELFRCKGNRIIWDNRFDAIRGERRDSRVRPFGRRSRQRGDLPSAPEHPRCGLRLPKRGRPPGLEGRASAERYVQSAGGLRYCTRSSRSERLLQLYVPSVLTRQLIFEPSRYQVTERLRDGNIINIRAISPNDRERFEQGFAQFALSPDSVRFHGLGAAVNQRD